MLNKIWQYIKRLFQQLLIIFPPFPQDNSSRRTPVAPPRLTRTDADYEAIFMQLLEEVNRGTSSGNVAGFLMVKGVKETELAAWLRQFGERLLRIDHPSVASLQELARRLVLLSEIRGGELGGVAGEFGKGILAKFPLPEEDWRGKVIEAVFVGDGLGREINRKGAEGAEGNEDVNQEADVWFNRGNEKAMRGDFEGAIASWDKAIEIKPDDHEAWNNRGSALDNLGRFEEAIASFDKAIEFKPDLHKTWNNRGAILCDNLRDFEGAIASFDKALELKPDFHDAWYNQGVALRNLGQFEGAIASWDKAIEIKPDFYEAWISQGNALESLGRFEEALAFYGKAIAIKSDNHYAWNNQGLALNKLERYEEAIASFDKAIEFKPDLHEAWLNRGLALGNLRRFEEAIASYDEAIEFKPDDYRAWYNRGNAAGMIESYLSPFTASSLTLQNPTLNQRSYQGRLASFQVGLQYVQKDKEPKGWGMLHYAIGKAHYFKWLSDKRRFANLCREAIISYDQALKTLTKEPFPEERLEVLQDYIKALLSLRKTREATQLRGDNKDLLDYLLAKTKNPTQQQRLEIKLKLASFDQLTVDTLVQSEQWIEALETAEEGKNTCLSWLFSDESSPKYPEIQQLSNPATAAVYWHLSPYALHTFIIKSGEPIPIVIGLETESLTRLDEFEKWVKKWNQEYAKGKGEKQEGGAQTWRDNLQETLKELGNILNIATIEERVRGIKNLILIPHRDLHRFPIHALFGDEFIISYLPSAKLGLGLAEKQKSLGANEVNLLSIEEPKSKSEHENKPLLDLPFATVESEYICRFFCNNQRLAKKDVTLAEVEKYLLEKYSIVHFTGHASYNFHIPSKSALCLTGKERLRVENILQMDLSQCELVSLSACETAITGNQTITTEYVGLVSAFLSRGVSRVASTLWTVQSDAAGLVMMKFYQLRQDKSDVEALNEAARWLRDLTAGKLVEWYQAIMEELPKDSSIRPDIRAALVRARKQTPDRKLYAHHYYWAPFIITGITR